MPPIILRPPETPDLDIQTWEVVENLHRSDLDRIERAQLTAEYWELRREQMGEDEKLVQVAPVSKRGIVEGRGNKSGERQIARELGRPRDEVRRDLAIARLSQEAKDAARKLIRIREKQSSALTNPWVWSEVSKSFLIGTPRP